MEDNSKGATESPETGVSIESDDVQLIQDVESSVTEDHAHSDSRGKKKVEKKSKLKRSLKFLTSRKS